MTQNERNDGQQERRTHALPQPVSVGEGWGDAGQQVVEEARPVPQRQQSKGTPLSNRLEVGGKTYQDSGYGVGRCMIRFQCPECKGEAILNAYRGQPFHHGLCGGAAMMPVSLVLEPSSQDPKGSPRRGKA